MGLMIYPFVMGKDKKVVQLLPLKVNLLSLIELCTLKQVARTILHFKFVRSWSGSQSLFLEKLFHCFRAFIY